MGWWLCEMRTCALVESATWKGRVLPRMAALRDDGGKRVVESMVRISGRAICIEHE
jgi:hypothetical protein